MARRLHGIADARTSALAAAWLVTAMMALACQNSPIGPTPGTRVAARPVVPATLRWDVTAAACTPRHPVPDLRGAPPDLSVLDGGRLEATWYRPGDRSVIAEFHRAGGLWALCWWDTSGL